jgi:transposase
LAQKLLAAGEQVVDIPPKLSSRVRVLSTGNARKNDSLDATFTALAALRNDRVAEVLPEDGPQGHTEILKMLTERREDLVAERTRTLNRLHVLLRDLLCNPCLGSSSPPIRPRSCCVAPGRGILRAGYAGSWLPSW